MVLYEGQLLLESGKPDEALKHLQAFEQHICDLLTYWETKGMFVDVCGCVWVWGGGGGVIV